MKNIIARKEYTEKGTTYKIAVEAGLHYLKGNNAPYFSITASVDREGSNGRWKEYMGGCCHEEIQKVFGSRFDDIIALHLSNIDGVPTHAVENGFYHAGGCGSNEITEAGHKRYQLERACGDNVAAVNAAMEVMGIDKEPLTFWKRYEDTGKPEVLASHLRISLAKAREICQGVMSGAFTKDDMKVFVESQIPRWNAEAKACIDKHGLVVFGDAWTGKAA